MWPFNFRKKQKPNPNLGLTVEQRIEANIAAATTCKYCGASLATMTSEARMNHINAHIHADPKLRGFKGMERLGL